MGMTIIEKIMARASGAKKVSPGDLVVVDVDTAVFIDNAFFPAAWREVLHVADPSKIVVVFDHRAPASDRTAAAAHIVGREFVQALRHQPLPRCRPRCRHRPCRGLRPRLCAARLGAGLRRFAHLQRRRLQLRGARRRRARHDLRRRPPARPGSASARRSATTSRASSAPGSPPRTCSCISPASSASTPTRTSSSAAAA